MASPSSSQFAPNTVFDSLAGFDGGMNAGVSPLLLPKNQLAWASNATNRGSLIHPRPPRRVLTLNFPSQAVQTAVTKGLWQGSCYYKPDAGVETLVASIAGRLYTFTPIGTVATVADVTGGNPQSATALQCWLWQAENYVFWNDGINLPVFFNGTTTARSNGTPAPAPPAQTYTVATDFVIPGNYNGLTQTVAITLTGNFTGPNGDSIVLSPGTASPLSGSITAGSGTPNITAQFAFINNGPNYRVAAGTQLIDVTVTPVPVAQFPVGRMGAYGRGRVWMCLANGKDFVAGDIVSGPSGTKALNFRDAVLNITENAFLVGGGTFTIPGSIGDIRAMIFTAQLDAALGQGPLMVFTPSHVFSCNAPVDRLTWQTLTNPILTEAAIGNGGLGQNSTFLVNSDTHSRSIDGIRSLILASQDFQTWIRTPISHEVERVLSRDNQSLLAFGSGVFFDNRTLMTVSPISTTQGVYHQALVVLNTDLITTVREKHPPAYDGVWPGMNVFQMLTGQFSQVERCYQFSYNPVLQTLELWELLPSSASEVERNPNTSIIDDSGQSIEWWFEAGNLFRENDPARRTFKRLANGEIFVDQLVGRVDFQSFYRPDQWACWVPWLSWSECAQQGEGLQPGFKPRMGLGEPSGTPCDSFTNRPFREFYSMQFKLVVIGQCRFLGARFAAIVLPEPTFAPPSCSPIC